MPTVSISDMCANPMIVPTLAGWVKEPDMTGSILYFDPGFRVDFPGDPVIFPAMNMEHR